MNANIPNRPGAAGLRRIRSVGGAELLLFWRNRTALFNALVLPVAFALAIATADVGGGALPANAFLLTGLCAVVLLIAGYYNLVTTYVARREELVLKRLRVGELTDAEILAGTAGPSVAVALGQIVLIVAGGAAFLGLPVPVNLPVLLAGVLAGTVVVVLLAAVSAVFTRTVETAQVSTLPILLVCLIGSSVLVPVAELPGTVAAVARVLPLSPVVELMRLGWLGTTGSREPAGFVAVFGLAAAPAAILAGWVVIGSMAVRRWFRWEPRR
jgi:ABC-2 type transport system permease protein